MMLIAYNRVRRRKRNTDTIKSYFDFCEYNCQSLFDFMGNISNSWFDTVKTINIKHGIDIIGNVWNGAIDGDDPIEAYKRVTNINQDQLNDEMFECAQRNVYFDYKKYKSLRSYRTYYNIKLITNSDGSYQIPPEQCTQSYGFTPIQLEVPNEKMVTVKFTGITGNNTYNTDNDQDFDPFLTAMKYKDGYKFFFIFKCVCALVSLIFLFVMIGESKNHGGVSLSYIIIVLIFFGSIFISLSMEMPLWFFHIFQKWNCCCEYSNDISKRIKDTHCDKCEKKFMRGFKYISILGISICIMIIAIILLSQKIASPTFDISQSRLNNTKEFKGQPWAKENGSFVKSSMCFTRIHNINFIQLASLTLATYISDVDGTLDAFNKSMFYPKNSKVQIDNMKFLTFKDNDAIMLQTDISYLDENYKNNSVAVLSIRGSKTKLDWWLDFEMFASSAMLSVARWLPTIQRLESKTTQAITSFLTLPLKTFENVTLFNKYTKTLTDAYETFLKDPNNEKKEVIFAGHSLAGGLSKFIATKYGKQSFSVSGPGVTPLEFKFSSNEGYNKYFKSTFVDIIPDNDIVPRLESSGGIKYRLLCEESSFKCHKIDRTICMMGLMCHDEHYTGDFCRGSFYEKEL